MEHVVCSSLMKHASQNNIFYALQHGFKDRRSCETQLLEFVQDIVTNMQDGLQTDVCVCWIFRRLLIKSDISAL